MAQKIWDRPEHEQHFAMMQVILNRPKLSIPEDDEWRQMFKRHWRAVLEAGYVADAEFSKITKNVTRAKEMLNKIDDMMDSW